MLIFESVLLACLAILLVFPWDENEADDNEELVEDVLDVHWKSHVHLVNVPGK